MQLMLQFCMLWLLLLLLLLLLLFLLFLLLLHFRSNLQQKHKKGQRAAQGWEGEEEGGVCML